MEYVLSLPLQAVSVARPVPTKTRVCCSSPLEHSTDTLENITVIRASPENVSTVVKSCKNYITECHFPKYRGAVRMPQAFPCEWYPNSYGTATGCSQHERHVHPELSNQKCREAAEASAGGNSHGMYAGKYGIPG